MFSVFDVLSVVVLIGLEFNGFLKYQQVHSATVPASIQGLMSANCSSVEEKDFPLIKITHSDEIHNSSFDVIESSDVLNEHSGYTFSITCVAPYPIEWVVNYFYNGYPNGNFGLHLQVWRKFGNFVDPSTYRFTISSKLRYKNNHGFKNFSFSCQSVDQPKCLQTKLYTSSDDRHDGKKGMKVNVVNVISGASWDNESISEVVPREEGLTLPILSLDDQSSSCDFLIYEKNLGSNRFSLSCEFEDGTPGMVKVIQNVCSNAISCMTFHQQHHISLLLADKCVKPLLRNNSCTTCLERTFRLSQGFFACVPEDKDNNHLHYNYGKLIFFFSSIPQQNNNRSSKLYYSMKNVTASEMMSLARISKKVSRGDQIHVECNTSSYYFAGGTKFGVKYKGSSEITYIKAIANPSNAPEFHFPNIYEAHIPITSTGTIEKIICFSPTWNSFAWVNKSIDVEGTELTGSPHIALAVGITLLVTTLFCCLLFGLCWMKILRRKLSTFGKLLTPQEIEDFHRRPILSDEKLAHDYDNVNLCKNEGISYLEIKREQLLLDETVVLGKGQIGKVLKGVYSPREKTEKIDVAVKTLKTKSDRNALKSLLSELKIMATVGRHLNVVNLIGACTKKMAKGEVYVCVEYCLHGSLQNYLRTHRDKFKNQLQRDILIVETPYSIQKSEDDDTILSLDLIKWAWEISRGMNFLSEKRIIHGDLACRNILLTAEKVAKISDFGLSKKLVDYYYYVKEDPDVAMPWKWMSIESLRELKFSINSDVWSFGVTLYELFTLGEVPYYGCSWSAEFINLLESGHRLGKPQYATTEMYDVMMACWNKEPSERPSFSTIKTFFEDIITQCTYQDYMQLELGESRSNRNSDASRTPLLTLTPTIEVVSDCEVEDDVFEQ